jgi:hypothetical protein
MNRRASLVIGLVLGSVGCITGEEPGGPASSQAPALSAEDQAANANLETKKLADVPIAGGKVSFYELEPGEFMAKMDFAMGAQPPALPAGGSLLEAYRAVAPAGPVPEAIAKAIEREAAMPRHPEAVPATIQPAATFAEEPVSRVSATPADGIEQRSSALASSIDANWFHSNYCAGYGGPVLHYCNMAAAAGSNIKIYNHKGNNITCGDTGAFRLRMKISGTTRFHEDFAYGHCGGWWWHGPHSWLTGELYRTVEYTVTWTEAAVRYAGYSMDSDDSFHNLPPGFDYSI